MTASFNVDCLQAQTTRRKSDEVVVDIVEKELKKKVKLDTVSYDDVPAWLQFNPFVKNGYRLPTHSFASCAKSVFHLHNETVNIWTHVFGAVLYCALSINLLQVDVVSARMSLTDYLVASVGAVGCFSIGVCSSLNHIFFCHSEELCHFFSKVDYLGIAVGSVLCVVAQNYFLFYGHPWVQWFYGVLTLIGAFWMLQLCVQPRFRDARYNHLRLITFAVFHFVVGVCPTVQCVLFDYIDDIEIFCWLVNMYVANFFASVFYVSFLPERLRPGHFDIWLHSHQVFHVLNVMGGIAYYRFLHLIVADKLECN